MELLLGAEPNTTFPVEFFTMYTGNDGSPDEFNFSSPVDTWGRGARMEGAIFYSNSWDFRAQLLQEIEDNWLRSDYKSLVVARLCGISTMLSYVLLNFDVCDTSPLSHQHSDLEELEVVRDMVDDTILSFKIRYS
jgi:hypothetical protein